MPDTVKDELKYNTAKAGEIGRHLALAGLAFIWLFNLKSGTTRLAEDLRLPFVLLILSLCIDVLQYVVGSVLWWFQFDKPVATPPAPGATIPREVKNAACALVVVGLVKMILLGFGYWNLVWPVFIELF